MARASTHFSSVPTNTAGLPLHAEGMRCERRLAREATAVQRGLWWASAGYLVLPGFLSKASALRFGSQRNMDGWIDIHLRLQRPELEFLAIV